MFLDVVCLAIFLWATFKGLRKGFVVGVFSFFAFIIGLAAALKLSIVAAEYIGANTNIAQRWIPFIAFAAVFFVVVLLVRLGAKAIEAGLRIAMLGWLNRLGGMILYIFIYFFILSIILFYLQQLNVLKKEALDNSLVYPYIQPLGPHFIGALGYIIPFFKNMFTELEMFFQGISGRNAMIDYQELLGPKTHH
jgi:membrane protein required for colicin V production